MTAAERLDAYARLTVEVGINLQPGQVLDVLAFPEHAPLVRAVGRAAYGAGASYVTVEWRDPGLRRALADLAPESSLDWSPPWEIAKLDWLDENRGAILAILGDPDPRVMDGADPARVARAIRRSYIERGLRSDNERAVNWSIVAYPNPGWAERIFGEPDVERLWELVVRAVRLDEPDPVAAWQTHVAMLGERAQRLDEMRFDAVRFRGPGTDLLVGLSPRSRWKGAVEGPRRLPHVVNLPTEEVFTTPDRRRTKGTVRCTRPVALPGKVAEGVELGFREGRVVDVRAVTGADDLRERFAFDDGASMLGEVAIVDRSSRVGELGVVFFDTLFDENATSHVALGSAYLSALRRAARHFRSRSARPPASTSRSCTRTSCSVATRSRWTGWPPTARRRRSSATTPGFSRRGRTCPARVSSSRVQRPVARSAFEQTSPEVTTSTARSGRYRGTGEGVLSAASFRT